jgi:hypothetical protein
VELTSLIVKHVLPAEGYVTTQKNTLKSPKTSESTQNYPWRTPKKLVIPKKVNPESPKKARNTKQNPGVPPPVTHPSLVAPDMGVTTNVVVCFGLREAPLERLRTNENMCEREKINHYKNYQF